MVGKALTETIRKNDSEVLDNEGQISFEKEPGAYFVFEYFRLYFL